MQGKGSGYIFCPRPEAWVATRAQEDLAFGVMIRVWGLHGAQLTKGSGVWSCRGFGQFKVASLRLQACSGLRTRAQEL